MSNKAKKHSSSPINRLFSSIFHFFKEVFDLLKHALSVLWSYIKANAKQIFAAFVILIIGTALSYSLVLSASAAVAYMIYSMNSKINKNRTELANDPFQLNAKNTIESRGVNLEDTEEVSYRLYGYFSYLHKHEQGKPCLDSEQLSYRLIEDKFDIVSIFSRTSSSSLNIANNIDCGIYGIIANYKNEDMQHRVLVGVRGTDATNIDETVLSDFEEGGPGFTSYQNINRRILDSIDEVVETGTKSIIDITGHSFGGGVSQMIAVDLLERIANNHSGYENITQINLPIFQSAGVSPQYCNRASAALAQIARTKPAFKFNMLAHCYDGDIVHASSPYILGNYAGNNADLYLVRKHMTLWVFLMSLCRNPFSSHLLPFYNKHGDIGHELVMAANLNAPLQYYSSVAGDQRPQSDNKKIKEYYNADYMRFLCNGSIHKALSYIGMNKIRIVRDLLLLTAATTFFVIKLIACIMMPSLITFSVMLVSIFPVLIASSAPSLLPLREKFAKFLGIEPTGYVQPHQPKVPFSPDKVPPAYDGSNNLGNSKEEFVPARSLG